MRLTNAIYLLSFFVWGSTSFSQPSKNILFDRFSEQHGISLSRHFYVFQDKKGYIWFGPTLGLVKYDGYSFTTHYSDPSNKHGLSTTDAIYICNDSLSNLWVVGGGGISKYNPLTQDFTWPFNDSIGNLLLPSHFVRCVVTDRKGSVWVGTGKGLCTIDTTTGKIVNLSSLIFPDTLVNSNIWSLMVDHKGLIWIGTQNGINIYDPSTHTIKLFKPPDKNWPYTNADVKCILEDHEGTLWFGLWNKGIYRFTPSNGISRLYKYSSGNKNTPGSDAVTSIIEDSHHTIWAGTYGGISIYQPETDDFRRHQFEANNPHSLNSNAIEAIFEDRTGVIWICTNGGGLNTYASSSKNFRVYQNWENKDLSRKPTGLSRDHTGKIYMTSFGSGVQELNPSTGIFKSYMVPVTQEKLKAVNYYFGSYESSDHTLWVMGFYEGLHQLDRETGKIKTIYSNTGTNISNCMAEDFDRRLWIGTNRGLKCFDLKTKKYSPVEELFPSTSRLLFVGGIAQLYCDPKGVLWVANDGALNAFNTRTGESKDYKHEDNNPHTLVNNIICSIYDDKKGTLWIGTEGGLAAFDKKTETFTNYGIKEGLPDNSVWSILQDDMGNLWFGTRKGICRFTPPSPENHLVQIRNYDMNDGLPTNDFTWNNSVRDEEGTLYFGSQKGIVAFKPKDLKDNTYIPPVVITEFSVSNKPISVNDSTGILKLPPDETKLIHLNYQQNDISFTFAALSYVHPEKNEFAHRLVGYDEEWIHTDATKRFANYTNLDPGTYTFKVRASNNDGLWNDKGVEVKIIISPPWWKTTWFAMLCFLVGGLILYGIMYYRMEKRREISRIRNKIASDLHDDLGATLSSISIMSELVNLQIKDQAPEVTPLLEKIGSSSRNMIASVNDMVWAINPQNDSFENIVKRMRAFASEILSVKDIAFHFDIDPQLLSSKLKMEYRRHFYLIYKEAVNNIAKYSHAASTFVKIGNQGITLEMTIRDDGMGFEPAKVKSGNGLINMTQRARAMNAHFSIESIPGKGTTLHLKFKNE